MAGNSGEDPAEIDAPTNWQWNPDTPVKRLQWQQGNLGFSLTFVGYQEGSTQITELLSQDDLLKIAGSISAITASNAPDPILITYEVQDGDTCTSIAQQFGTQVNSLVSLNTLSDNCELIFSGQQLQVPLTVIQEPLFTLDLDCNGSQERVTILTDPNARNSGSIYGFTIQTLASTGLFQDRWSYNITDTNAEQLNQPSTFSINSCQRGLRLENSNPTDGNVARLEFRWDGEKMVRLQPEP